MATIDIFNPDSGPFSMASLSRAVEKIEYKPNLIGSLNLFTPKPIRTSTFFVEWRDRRLRMVPTSALHAPPTLKDTDKRRAKSFETVRLAQMDRIHAAEIANIRAYGSETELAQMQVEVASREKRMLEDLELTREYHRLGALQGVVLDADGSSVLYDWYDEFNITKPADYSFALTTDTTNVREQTQALVREMRAAGNGVYTNGVQIHALCGSGFYNKYVHHKSVEKFYDNFQTGRSLRNAEGSVHESFFHGNVTFHDYRGTDDGSTIAIGDDEAWFFPVGASDVFDVVQSPAMDKINYVNTLGRPQYSWIDRDTSSEPSFVDVHLNAYTMHVCNRPEALRRGVAA